MFTMALTPDILRQVIAVQQHTGRSNQIILNTGTTSNIQAAIVSIILYNLPLCLQLDLQVIIIIVCQV